MSKQLQIQSWPRVLVISLKIFDIHGKLDRRLTFPHTLRYATSPTYRIRAFIEHLAQGKQGHYITFTRTDDDSWFYHSDADPPREVSRTEVAARQPYCLFYAVSYTHLRAHET